LRFLVFILVFLFSPLALFSQSLSLGNISSYIQQNIGTKVKAKNRAIVKEIYAQMGNQPIWVGNHNSRKVTQLIQALNNPLFNYKNKSFDQASISRLFFMLDTGEVSASKQSAVYARLDLILTSSMVRLVRFIVQGDVDWALVSRKLKAMKSSDDIKAHWEMKPKAFPASSALVLAIENENIKGYLTSLIPMEKRYKKLIKMLKDYRVMNTFPKINYAHKPLGLGNDSSRVKAIKQRLQITGDYPQGIEVDSRFDERTRQAVMSYQKRYLLKVTGIVDNSTMYYLNQPASKNIQAIITNLDKTKLYPKRFEAEHIEINIPDFNLRYYKNHSLNMKKGIVVGRIDRPTPLFSDAIEYMVLNPTWTIPDNLIKRDLIHVLRENPSYLEENNIHVFSGNKEISIGQSMLDKYEHSSKRVPYRFVQYPGDSNALGRVKFIFPNKYAVYLHDTDNKSLLSRRYKIYSSGCMRVEQPFELVDKFLSHAKGSYSHAKIESILESMKPTTIRLRKNIPVHIVYFTVYEENGKAYFKNDIYLYDQIIQESVVGNKKSYFTVPKKRMVSVRKVSKPLGN
jgi:murein L,D-transpeptidase YcbB/YkuD